MATALCPSDAELARLLDGDSGDAATHLEACPRCRARLEQLAAGGATWDAVAAGFRRPEQASPALAAAIASLKSAGGDEESASPDLPPGFFAPPHHAGHLGRLDGYEIVEEVGRGEMGIVFKAIDERLQRVVALKVMSPRLAGHVNSRHRFIREGRAAAAVCHEHVVTLHAVADGPLPYFVMQYVGGQSLQQRLDKSGPLKLPEILRIGMQTADGLAAAHAQGLVHRDIKPANILLENGVERVKLTDFGLARAVDDASLTRSGVIAGTPLFMAPEQARGEPVDHRADLFSLGCVLYTLAAGRPPFRAGSTLAVLKRICEDEPRPIRELNPDMPDWLAGIIAKLLAKDPADRFASARELSELLAGCLAHVQRPGSVPLPAAVNPPPLPISKAEPAPPLSPEARRRSWLLTTPGGIAVLMLAAVGPMLIVLLCGGITMLAWMLDTRMAPQATLQPPLVAVPEPAPAPPPASPEELMHLDRLVEIARQEMQISQARFERAVAPASEHLAAQRNLAVAELRYFREARQNAKYLDAAQRSVKLSEQLLEVVAELVDVGAATPLAKLEAERALAEAKLELQAAQKVK